MTLGQQISPKTTQDNTWTKDTETPLKQKSHVKYGNRNRDLKLQIHAWPTCPHT